MSDMYDIAIPLVAKWEGLHLHPYFCPANKLTIGYGEVIKDDIIYGDQRGIYLNQVADEIFFNSLKDRHKANKKLEKEFNNLISEEFAKKQLEKILRHKWRIISKSLPVGMNNNKCAAVASFTYNVGTGAFLSSTLLRKIQKNHDDPEIRNQFMRWVWAAGRKMDGLKNRREDEANTYFS